MSSPEIIIQLVSLARGLPHPACGQYVVTYDPRPVAGDGGLLDITPDPLRAKRFSNTWEALTYYRQTTGRTRPDGRPDRPLTAFTVAILTLTEVAAYDQH